MSMMKTKLALCAMFMCVTSAIAVGQTVSVNYNHSQSFSGYHTYAWGSNNANQIQNSILAQVAQQDIDAAMQGKGFQKVQESQKPDLILTANGGMRQ
jgi:methyltransferase-like protein